MTEKNNKILIIITIILLILLVGIVLIKTITPKTNKTNVNDKEVNDNRCVDNVCISKVSIDEKNDIKTVTIVIKNEGKDKIENSCVIIKNAEMSVKYCFDELQADGESTLVLNADGWSSDNIKDYKIEKAKTISEENQNQIVTE